MALLLLLLLIARQRWRQQPPLLCVLRRVQAEALAVQLLPVVVMALRHQHLQHQQCELLLVLLLLLGCPPAACLAGPAEQEQRQQLVRPGLLLLGQLPVGPAVQREALLQEVLAELVPSAALSCGFPGNLGHRTTQKAAYICAHD